MTDVMLISFGAAVTFTAFCGAYIYMRSARQAEASRQPVRRIRTAHRAPRAVDAAH